MRAVSAPQREVSLEALRSAIRKSERSCERMQAKGVATVLVERRLAALRAGLAVLESSGNHALISFTDETLIESRGTLADLHRNISTMFGKTKEGTAQHTLMSRRLFALECAIEAIDDLLDRNGVL